MVELHMSRTAGVETLLPAKESREVNFHLKMSTIIILPTDGLGCLQHLLITPSIIHYKVPSDLDL